MYRENTVRIAHVLNSVAVHFNSAEQVGTVEVGSLPTLRLESLNHVFQPFPNFLLTNYSFGKSDRTSTLCMTQAFFPTIVYRQIISDCITIPVGQKFTYTKLTVPLNSLENFRK